MAVHRQALFWSCVSAALAILIGVLLLFLPLGASEGAVSESVSPGDSQRAPGGSEGVPVFERHSLLEKDGWATAGFLLIPVALSAAPLLVPSRARRPVTVGATIALAAGIVLSIASVGLFYLPVLVTMILAVFKSGAVAAPPGVNPDRRG